MRRVIVMLSCVLVGCGSADSRGTDASIPDEAVATQAASEARPVWIDTDPSIRPGGHEVDDGFALIQAFHSPELAIRGVSLVFGNAPLDVEIPIGREIVELYGPPGLDVSIGAASGDDLGETTEASVALANALRQERLTILALGPGTNVGTVLLQNPELADQIVEVIAVAGRRPGQSFVTGDLANGPHCDCNFDKDTESFQVILDAGVPLTLAPWEISSKVWLRTAELDRLEQAGAGAQYLVSPARDWLALWNERYGVDGFNPFDTLAVGYLTTSETIMCDTLPVEIVDGLDDQAVAAGQAPPTTQATACRAPRLRVRASRDVLSYADRRVYGRPDAASSG